MTEPHAIYGFTMSKYSSDYSTLAFTRLQTALACALVG